MDLRLLCTTCMHVVHAALELIESILTAVDNKKHLALEYSLTLKRLIL